jgi:hypothetical protein
MSPRVIMTQACAPEQGERKRRCSVAANQISGDTIKAAEMLRLPKYGTSLLCRTAGGEVGAAIFIVWNDQYCHYLLSTRDERIACNGAVSLLIWNALQLAGQMNRGFDFDGFGTNGAANFLRQFGARLVPRWTLLRAPRLVRALLMSRSRFFNSEPS